jgi:hypothetical protein
VKLEWLFGNFRRGFTHGDRTYMLQGAIGDHPAQANWIVGMQEMAMGVSKITAANMGKRAEMLIDGSGQVRRLLDIFAGAASFESCVLRPT